MAIAGACPAKKFARVFVERRWKSNDVWMARTGYASAAATCACAIAQHPCDRPQVLPAYGLQDSRNEEQNQKTKSNPNTMCQRITPGGNRGTGHFYLAKNRTFLLCVDTKTREVCRCKMRMSGLCKVEMSGFIGGRGPHGNGANRFEPTGTGQIARATRGPAEADHADRSRQAVEDQ